ncbi:jg27087, partial [Pararge aegeria aegeria]
NSCMSNNPHWVSVVDYGLNPLIFWVDLMGEWVDMMIMMNYVISWGSPIRKPPLLQGDANYS